MIWLWVTTSIPDPASISKVKSVTTMQLATDGARYRFKTHFARFLNIPELMYQSSQVTNIPLERRKTSIPFRSSEGNWEVIDSTKN
jgi:hypothetical protein